MKCIILYSFAGKWQDNQGYSPIIIRPENIVVPVRAEVVEADNLSDALDLAQPRAGEVVLNTVEADVLGKARV